MRFVQVVGDKRQKGTIPVWRDLHPVAVNISDARARVGTGRDSAIYGQAFSVYGRSGRTREP